MTNKCYNHFSSYLGTPISFIIRQSDKIVNIVELHEKKNLSMHILIVELHKGTPRKREHNNEVKRCYS